MITLGHFLSIYFNYNKMKISYNEYIFIHRLEVKIVIFETYNVFVDNTINYKVLILKIIYI